jgi:hypothetical protein
LLTWGDLHFRSPDGWTYDEAPDILARHAPRIVLIPPQAKQLA